MREVRGGFDLERKLHMQHTFLVRCKRDHPMSGNQIHPGFQWSENLVFLIGPRRRSDWSGGRKVTMLPFPLPLLLFPGRCSNFPWVQGEGGEGGKGIKRNVNVNEAIRTRETCATWGHRWRRIKETGWLGHCGLGRGRRWGLGGIWGSRGGK